MSHTLPIADESDANHEQPRLHLFDADRQTLREWLAEAGEAGFRADQVLQWMYARRVSGFDAMTNISRSLRERLGRRSVLFRSELSERSASQDGTQKLLLTWPDGAAVETVWIPTERRNTVCLSSQVGCPVGCRFCASGLDGVQRNLTAGEIVEQAMQVSRQIDATSSASGAAGGPDRLTHVVMMGMGEPLANYEQVIRAIRILNAEWGPNIGARRITVSTVGLPKQIRRLADEDLQLNLALSLHAPDDELRAELIPWGRGVRIADLLDACRHYFRKTGREITLEYILLDDVNMAATHADQLIAIARSLRANVNLLRYNVVPGLPYRRPSSEKSYIFQRQLRAGGVNAHVRTSRGRDVDAACGQLRRAAGGGTV